MLGKRKRDVAVAVARSHRKYSLGQEASVAHNDDAQDVFRRHFESTFSPLPLIPKQVTEDEIQNIESADEQTENSDWSGFSETEDGQVPIVVEHGTPMEDHTNGVDRAFQKAFMGSKPPRQPVHNDRKTTEKETEEDGVEKLNIKHDLELQRLLKESHLLEKTKSSSEPGLLRQRALDARFQDIGAKSSMFTQTKMPFSHRKGITEKAAQKENKRRQHAKENGIVLEKAVKKSSERSRRDRGVDVPAIGKFQSGTLKLSRRDITSMQSSNSAPRRQSRR